jgi:hypothetical protein
MAYSQCAVGVTAMVGDDALGTKPHDSGAAKAAGVRFFDANAFFASPRVNTPTITDTDGEIDI